MNKEMQLILYLYIRVSHLFVEDFLLHHPGAEFVL